MNYIILFIMLSLFIIYIYWSKRELKNYHEVLLSMVRTMDRINVELKRVNLSTECFIAEMVKFKKSKEYKEWKQNN
jgi:hypothetical protein